MLGCCCRVLSAVKEKFHPSAVVCQCGADVIAGDPQACFNLTPQGMARCIQYLMDFNIPLVLLGGGDYVVHWLTNIGSRNVL